MNFFDRLWGSMTSAFSLGNFLKRVGFFLLFGFLLGLTKLISGLDSAGANGEGFMGVIKAFLSATKYGVGVGHATFWDVLRDLMTTQSYFAGAAWGTIIFGFLFFVGLMGFYFQPVSLFINVFDFKGKEETGDRHGNATSGVVRIIATLAVVLIISSVVFYSGASASIAGGGDLVGADYNSSVQEFPDNHSASDEGANTSIVNSLNMLTGG